MLHTFKSLEKDSLLKRLRASLFILAMVPLTIGLLVLLAEFLLFQHAQLNDQYQRRVNNLAKVISNYFDHAEHNLSAPQQLLTFNKLPPKEQKEILLNVLYHDDTFINIAYLDPNGIEQAHYSRRNLVSKPSNIWRDMKSITGAIKQHQITYGDIMLDPASGESNIDLAIPIINIQNGKLDGILVGTISLKPVWQELARLAKGTDDDSFIVDTHHNIIAHLNPSIALSKRTFNATEGIDISRDLDGRYALTASAKIKLPGNILTAVLTRPITSAYMLILIQLATAFITIIIAFILTLRLLKSVSNQLLKPINSLTHTAQQISNGQLDVRANDNYHGELATLANAFNLMVNLLHQQQEVLEQRVQERTQALLNTKNEAERANNAKTEFLSRMSHELRTPLNGILGFAQLLELDPQASPQQQENLQEILAAGNHLLDLINEILDLARIESGKIELTLEATPVDTLAQECIALVKPLAEKRKVTIEADIPSHCAAWADRMRFKQILLNLLSNSIKYNKLGGNVKLSCQQKNSETIRIIIKDTGNGIPEEARSRMFKPFERLESAYTGAEGTGIGLALCKYLAEAMHGSIDYESITDQGSTFWVDIPLASNSSDLLISAAPTIALQHHHEQNDTTRTILYIEDNPSNLNLVTKIISKNTHYKLMDAHTAELGISAAIAYKPDLILMDINLPGMDGFAAIKILRENTVTQNIPVIAISANAMTKDTAKGKAAGFEAYLTKPLNIPTFLTTLDKFIQQGRNADH